MPTLPIQISEFAGLQLAPDPQEVGYAGAVDLLNVEINRPGRLYSRAGYTSFASHGSIISGLHTFTNPSGAPNLLAVGTSTAKIYNVSGGSPLYTSTVTRTNDDTWFADAGDPDGQYTIFTVRGETFINFWPYGSTVAGTTPAGPTTGDVIPGPFHAGPLAVTPWDHRLVACDPVSSAVYFSDLGDPSSFATNNFLMLDPGDGEQITEAVAWGSQVFVFKQTKFYVFYGTGTDSTGQPVFNYRTVNARQGAVDAGCVVASPEGVYFLNPAGLWLTTGGMPKLVSGDVAPLFLNQVSPYLNFAVGGLGLTLAQGHMKLALAENKVHVFSTVGSLFYDRAAGGWGATDQLMSHAAGLNTLGGTPSVNGSEKLVFSNGSTIFGSGGTTDNGTAITSRYRTGFFSPAVFSSSRTRRPYAWPAAEGIMRELLLNGWGTITVKSAFNDAVTLGAGTAVALGGSASAIVQRRDRRAVRGRNVSLELSGTGAWGVSGVVANVMDSRGPNQQEA